MSCGWCGSTCASLRQIPSNCTNIATDFNSCSICYNFFTCTECFMASPSLSCQWYNNVCAPSGTFTNGQSIVPNITQCPTSCSQRSTCSACLASDPMYNSNFACGWSSSTASCYSWEHYESSFQWGVSTAYAQYQGQCPNCAANTDCNSCLSEVQCGWCSQNVSILKSL